MWPGHRSASCSPGGRSHPKRWQPSQVTTSSAGCAAMSHRKGVRDQRPRRTGPTARVAARGQNDRAGVQPALVVSWQVSATRSFSPANSARPAPLPIFGDVHRKARQRVARARRRLGLPRREARVTRAWYSVAALRLDELAQSRFGARVANERRGVDTSARAASGQPPRDAQLGRRPRSRSARPGGRARGTRLGEPRRLRSASADPALPGPKTATRLRSRQAASAGAFRRMFDLPEAVALVRGAGHRSIPSLLAGRS